MTRKLDSIFKRALDIAVALAGLVALGPFFALVAALIRRESPGPIIFRGRRAGKDGKEFGILKFRTMYERPASYAGPAVTAKDDPRITPLGHWLRDTKINELPQLVNVLKGDMSMVGPRPEYPDLVDTWPEDTRREILSVRPGITSHASILFRDEESLLKSETVMDDYLSSILPTKLRLDDLYVRNRTWLGDLDIIFWTVMVLLPRLKEQRVPEHQLYWGPISRFVTRNLLWFLLDTLVAFVAVGLAGSIWRTSQTLELGVGRFAGLALATSVLFSLINTLTGLNRIDWPQASAADAIGMGLSSFLATLILYALNAYLFQPNLPPAMIVVSGLLVFIGSVGMRYRGQLITGLTSRWINIRGGVANMGERVLIIGAGDLGQLAYYFFHASRFAQAFNIMGMVDDDPRKQGLWIKGHPVLGRIEDIPALEKKLDIGLIVMAVPQNTPQAERLRILSVCQQTPARVVALPDVFSVLRNERLSPSYMRAWVEDLDRLVRAGAWDEVKLRLDAMKGSFEDNHQTDTLHD